MASAHVFPKSIDDKAFKIPTRYGDNHETGLVVGDGTFWDLLFPFQYRTKAKGHSYIDTPMGHVNRM